MLRYFLKKIGYGITVLFGVLSLVFFIFNLSPSDPSRLIAGQNDSEEVLQLIRHKLGLDLSVGERYLLYINDLSPLSIHSTAEDHASNWDDSSYSGTRFAELGNKELAVKWPYLRRSYISNRAVTSIIADSIPGTFILAISAILIALILGISLGVLSALNKDGLIDKLSLLLSAVGMSGPSFFMAIIIAWIGGLLWYDQINLALLPFLMAALVFIVLKVKRIKRGSVAAKWTFYAFGLGWIYIVLGHVLTESGFPGSSLALQLPGTGLGMTGSLYGVDVWKGQTLELKNLILPAITLGIRPLSVVVQLTRNSMLDVLQSDFVRTARAKGLSQARVVIVHGLRNALNPVVTAVSGWFASLLAGAVFVEFVFGWKGLGMEVFRALDQEDLPVVMGAVLVIATIFVFINILVDLAYAWLDPRVRLS